MFPIGEAARRSGVNVETIRYYEREGVLPAPARTAAGRRLYSREGIARIRFVKRCRDLGFSIRDATALLALSTEEAMACADARGIGERHLQQVRDKLGELARLEAGLAELIERCRAGETECPMLRQLLTDRADIARE